jgi:large subunit ribosomal protein L32e
MVDERLLKVRNVMKKKKPTFRRQQSNQFAKFKNSDSWRKPKGHQSKMRLRRKGHRAMPSVGYKSPKAVRGLNRNGFKEVLVYNVFDLENVDNKTSQAVIARTVGGKKRLDILKKGQELKISFANVFDIDEKIKSLTKVKKVEKKSAVKSEKTEEAKK